MLVASPTRQELVQTALTVLPPCCNRQISNLSIYDYLIGHIQAWKRGCTAARLPSQLQCHTPLLQAANS